MNLTISYITSRKQPKFEWFYHSLITQIKDGDEIRVVIVSLYPLLIFDSNQIIVSSVAPKPTVWQGEHRLTQSDHWAASNSRNTGICLCKTDWIAFCDDRCVLTSTWLQSVRDAMAGNYCVLGSYEKRINMKVENGVIIEPGEVTGKDCREPVAEGRIVKAPGQWLFGCTFALPLEWALKVNGQEELCDGLSMEDVIFGNHLENAGYTLKYDPRMKIIEDRTPSELGEAMKRTSKEKHPNDTTDKGHEALRRFGKLKRASHHWNLREIRERVLRGEPFPHHNGQPERDWFDQTLIKDA